MTSKSRIKKLVNLAIHNNTSLKDSEPISYEDLINSAEVVFEYNYIPLEVTITVQNNNEIESIEYYGNTFIENVPVEPYYNNIEIQSSENTLSLESEIICLNDNIETNINELITNDFSGVQENSNLDHCAEINSNSGKIKRQ